MSPALPLIVLAAGGDLLEQFNRNKAHSLSAGPFQLSTLN